MNLLNLNFSSRKKKDNFYSYRSATIGSSRAAFIAGYKPAKRPTAEQTTMPKIPKTMELQTLYAVTFPQDYQLTPLILFRK